MVAVFLGFVKSSRNDEVALQHFFSCLQQGKNFFSISLVLHAIFFFHQALAGNFFQNHPPPPPQDLNGRALREFRKLRHQLQRKHNIKIELCVKLSVLRLFHVEYLAQNRRSVLWLAWHQWFSRKDKEWRLALSSQPQI